ncbi:MAG: restriction endonuclease [Candidatus Aureabacteria bacterium]|mgnify:CR=1 FL=1|nr:restriction endonuclease [Candidatus Auribacterota bacterium]HOE27112.1 DNA methyltransferase [bacterium]HQM52048.1 DNA methyltransferase [bacterium]
MENILYYGDNLDILKRDIPSESVDLVYLDPPFKSNQNYNVLFKEQDGTRAASQIRAFEDTWTWSQDDEKVFADLVTAGGKVADVMQAFRTFLGPCDMLAYLVMMCPRLVELRRVLKPTGSIYLHCDPAASHYLKLLMDAIFGPENFRDEIVWKRADTVKGNFGQGARFFDRNTDSILFYAKTDKNMFHPTFKPYTKEYIDGFYKHVEPTTGRRYQLISMLGPGGASKGNPQYEVMGVTRFWRYSKEKMKELIDVGLVVQTSPGAVPRRKQYLDEGKGVPVQSLWDDIPALHSMSSERLGYPTQKPLVLLERIIQASSNEGDVVLDPFCGCGTTVVAAQKLSRRWIGIDVTHLAITLMKQRLKDTFGIEAVIGGGEVREPKDKPYFRVIGEPVSVPDATALAASDPYQFQWWALGLVGARPAEGKKGADKGIDGKIVFQGDEVGKFETVILSVKAGGTGAAHVRDLKGVLDREKAALGVLISMEEPTKPMRTEAATAGHYNSKMWGKKYPKIQLLTVADILAGKRIDMPPIRQVGATFKKAERHAAKGEQLELT